MGLPSFRGHGASRLSQPKPQRRQDGGKWMAQWRSVRCRSHWSHSWRFTRLGWWQRWWEIPAQGLNMPEIHVTVVVSCSTFLMEPGRVASQNHDSWNCENEMLSVFDPESDPESDPARCRRTWHLRLVGRQSAAVPVWHGLPMGSAGPGGAEEKQASWFAGRHAATSQRLNAERDTNDIL